MAQYNYQTGYPLNLEAGSTEKPLSAFQKVKAEFERLYRLLNSGLSTIDQLASQINSQIASIESLASNLRTQVQNALNTIDSKLSAQKTEIKNYVDGLLSDAGITGNCTVTIVQSGTRYSTYIDGASVQIWQAVRAGYGGSNHDSTFNVKYGSTISINAQMTTNGSNTVTVTDNHLVGLWNNGTRYEFGPNNFTVKFSKSNVTVSNPSFVTVLEPITITGAGLKLGDAWIGGGGH